MHQQMLTWNWCLELLLLHLFHVKLDARQDTEGTQPLIQPVVLSVRLAPLLLQGLFHAQPVRLVNFRGLKANLLAVIV